MIAAIAPEVRVIDLVHGISGVRAGSAIIAQSVVHAPHESVHLAIVDPGVGTERRGVVVKCDRGDLLVGPDNGLLPPAAGALGGAVAAFELADSRYRREPVSSTFHGRDVFAPAAAHLASGVPAESFGAAIDVNDLVRIAPPDVRASDGMLEAEVLRTDWYGNLQLHAKGPDITRADLGSPVMISCAAGEFEAIVGRTFADANPGDLVVYLDSGEHVAIARNGASARELLQDPDRVTLKRKL